MAYRLSGDFQNGRLPAWSSDDDRVTLMLAEMDDPWFHFLVTGAAGQRLSFHVPALERHAPLPISVSYDRWGWEPVTEPAAASGQFAHTFRSDAAVVSLAPPYTNGMLYELTLWARRSRHAEISYVGERKGGSEPLTCIQITEAGDGADKPIVWIVAREAPAAAGGSWLAEGLIRFLLSTDRRAAQLRDRFCFQIVPMLAFDDVAKGETGPRARWTAPSPAMAHIAQRIEEQHRDGAVVAAAVALHANNTGSTGQLEVTLPSGVGDSAQAAAPGLPWIAFRLNAERAGAFGAYVRGQFPGVVGIDVTTAWFYPQAITGARQDLWKGPFDLLQEGEQLAGAIARFAGVEFAQSGISLMCPRLLERNGRTHAEVALHGDCDGVEIALVGDGLARSLDRAERCGNLTWYRVALDPGQQDRAESLVATTAAGAQRLAIHGRKGRSAEPSLY